MMRVLLIVCVGLLMASCASGPPGSPVDPPGSPDGTVRLTVPPAGEAGARVIPDYATQFQLVVTGSGWTREVTVDRAASGDTVAEVTCPPGVGIDVTVDALDADGVDVASATEPDVTVTADETTALTITLNAFTGRLEITVQ